MQLFVKCEVVTSAISAFSRLPDQTLRVYVYEISKKKRAQPATRDFGKSLQLKFTWHSLTTYVVCRIHISSRNVHLATHSSRSCHCQASCSSCFVIEAARSNLTLAINPNECIRKIIKSL